MKGEKAEAQPTTGEVRCRKAERDGEKEPGFFPPPTYLSSSHLSSYWLNLPQAGGERNLGNVVPSSDTAPSRGN